jgi:hypothetical protein
MLSKGWNFMKSFPKWFLTSGAWIVCLVFACLAFIGITVVQADFRYRAKREAEAQVERAAAEARDAAYSAREEEKQKKREAKPLHERLRLPTATFTDIKDEGEGYYSFTHIQTGTRLLLHRPHGPEDMRYQSNWTLNK